MTPKDPISLAIMGTRGIPACYGGFETFAEELSTRLAGRGHKVTVYCRRGGACGGKQAPGDSSFRGVGRIWTWTVRHKYLETPLHGLTSFIDALFRRFDAALVCNAANSPFIWILKLKGLPVFVNVDGIERRRGKWSFLGRLWYRLGEICSALFADRIVADAQVIADYYRRTYGVEAAVIGYGAEAQPAAPGETLARYGLEASRYLLYVSRLEPENNALGVIRAYRSLETDMPLVIVGDAPYAGSYVSSLKEAADQRVVFTGFQFGAAYRELRANCYLYIQASEVGGTHPALVEAMAYGNCIVANRVAEHEEVLGDAGYYYARNDFARLGALLKELLAAPHKVKEAGESARARAAARYRWDDVVVKYEELCKNALRRRKTARVKNAKEEGGDD